MNKAVRYINAGEGRNLLTFWIMVNIVIGYVYFRFNYCVVEIILYVNSEYTNMIYSYLRF